MAAGRISTGVFNANAISTSTISDRTFYFVLGIMVMIGLAVTAFCASYASFIHYRPGTIEFLILGLGLPIAGSLIAAKSDNPVISFLGYMMITAPFGFILGPVVDMYSSGTLVRAAEATLLITFMMTLLSVTYPRLFAGLGGVLFSCLCGLLVLRLLQMFIPALAAMGIIDWFAAGLFSLYIGYDMYRASVIGKTVDNAIDVAVQLYLDIINLFLVLLRIFGRSDD